MKKALQFTLGIAALVAALNFQSCDKIKENAKPIDYTEPTADIVIPASAAGTTGDLATVSVSINIDSIVKAQSQSSPIPVSYSDIQTVKLTGMTLTLSDADATNNFGNFQVLGATFNTDASGGSLQPYIVTYIDPNPSTYSGMLAVPLIDKDTDLKQYFGAGKVMLTYAVTGTLGTATTHALHCHIDVTYEFGFTKP